MPIALLTGGGDQPYAFGLATALIASGVGLDIIAGDELDSPQFHRAPGVRFLNLRGDQRPDARLGTKLARVLRYYARLLRYAATAHPRVFHILWNNKFDVIDRTALMLYYRLLGKRIVLTVHNVNAGRRDASDTALNRFTLRFQYRFADHLFVHTDKMKTELVDAFGVRPSAVTVIPFGINNAVPNTSLTPAQAKQHLGIASNEKTLLFFGNIAPYKGLEYLATAFQQLLAESADYRLIIAGRPKGSEAYWKTIQPHLTGIAHDRVINRLELHSRRRHRDLLQGSRSPHPAVHRDFSERRTVPGIQLRPAGRCLASRFARPGRHPRQDGLPLPTQRSG